MLPMNKRGKIRVGFREDSRGIQGGFKGDSRGNAKDSDRGSGFKERFRWNSWRGFRGRFRCRFRVLSIGEFQEGGFKGRF